MLANSFKLLNNKSFQSKLVFRSLATYKTSTGLVGVEVDKNSREILQNLSATILASVKKFPESSQYRINVEQWFTYIKKVTTEKQDILEIEDEIELGQIEEVINMAKDELKLVDYYYEMKGWELVESAEEEATLIEKEMEDEIYFSSPESRASYVKPAPPPATSTTTTTPASNTTTTATNPTTTSTSSNITTK